MGTFKLLATGCYRHADASKPIPFNSPHRADYNETFSDSGRHLPAEVSPLCFRLTSIAIGTLRNLHHSIRLNRPRWIPTHPVPRLSHRWLKGDPFFGTLVLQGSTFKMLATGCYRHVDTSRPIPFDSPRRADYNEGLPDSDGHLPAEVSASFSLLTSIAIWTL